MQFANNNYYAAMDYIDTTQDFPTEEPAKVDSFGRPIVDDESLNFTARDLGTTTNPMTGQIEALKARIREGASRIEFSFLGAGKGNAQRPTPESFGSKERRDLRELLDANEMRTSTHAGVHSESLAGFTKEGFNSEARSHTLKEIKRAIHFAGEATKGGAVVFHTSEWQRPMSEIKDSMGEKYKFKAYREEDKDAIMFAVDSRTGQSVGGLRKDQEIFRPVFETAKDRDMVGKTDNKGNVLGEDDWIDVQGNKIDRYASVEKLFDRVPKFNAEKTNFDVEKLDYNAIVVETDKWNAHCRKGKERTPAEMAAILSLENQVLQQKGSSLYHAKHYEEEKRRLDRMREMKSFVDEIKQRNPNIEPYKLRKLFTDTRYYGQPPEDRDPEEWLNDEIKQKENSLRYTHEASAAADVNARDAEERIKKVQSAERYGIVKTAETIALAGLDAMYTYNKNKDKYGLKDPIYVAPENWDPRSYGSHPDEYRKIIEKSREKMAEMLMSKGKSHDEAMDLAKDHIKGTLDIGHLNMFRYHFEGSDEEFDKWMLKQTEDLVSKGYVGHIHLTDNFGFDDEHLTPGQGNVPMMKFLKMLEKRGMKDIIVEQGSFNPQAHLETLELINSPIYGIGRKQRFGQVWQAHYGQSAPPFFIAGSYVPSNDWRPWTEIPLE